MAAFCLSEIEVRVHTLYVWKRSTEAMRPAGRPSLAPSRPSPAMIVNIKSHYQIKLSVACNTHAHARTLRIIILLYNIIIVYVYVYVLLFAYAIQRKV